MVIISIYCELTVCITLGCANQLILLRFNMKSILKKLVLVSCTLLFLSACQIRPPVTADYDTQYDYSQLKSYAWVLPKEEAKSKVSTLDNRRQTNAIETILNRKGFTKLADGSDADFLLRTHTITDKKTDVDTFFNAWGYHPFAIHHPIGWPHQTSSTVVREYKIGTLVLDIVDPVKKEVIWRGSVSRKLGVYKNRTPEERDTIALTNAEFMLESFPPGSK